MSKPGRNYPCPCGSGRKFKQCCMTAGASSGPAVVASAPSVAARGADIAQALRRAVAAHQAGRLAEAQALYETVLSAAPDNADALNLMGVLALQVGHADAGFRLLQQALQAAPDHVDANYNLGYLLFQRQSFAEAAAVLQRVVALDPGHARAHGNLGCVYEAMGDLESAERHFRTALAIEPDQAAGLANLGNVLKARGDTDAAMACFARALALQPDDASVLYNLGLALSEHGRVAEATFALRRSLALRPDHAATHSTLLFTLLYDATRTPADLAAEHAVFAERFEAPLQAGWRPHDNARQLDKKLRVGFVSADLRHHPVAQFLMPLLRHRDAEGFVLYAYCVNARQDAITQTLRPLFDHWHDCATWADDVLAAQIRADGIDVLVDLSGHSHGNRLLALARKPAPLQIGWLGYPSTTGLAAIDYRVTDAISEPPDAAEFGTEIPWRLRGPPVCYGRPANMPAPLGKLPRDANGWVTFGCFNNFTKVGDPVLAAWSRILQRVPDARLLLEINGLGESSYRQRLEQRLQGIGMPMERVMLEARRPSNQYVLYDRVDIALDPFPYNGGTTTIDALSMGVPVVTLAGGHLVARLGASFLGHAGLSELVATTIDDYVDLAAGLALDIEALRRLRHGLRERIEAGPLHDGPAFTRDWEDALRAMWQRWCGSSEPTPASPPPMS